MKNELIFLFIIMGVVGASGQSSYLTVGVSKEFPLSMRHNHIGWMSYKSVTSNQFWVEVRGDFHAYEYQLSSANLTADDPVFALIPDNSFALSSEIPADNITAGIHQLPTFDQLHTHFYLNFMAGYRFDLQKWYIDLGIGAGATYSHRKSIVGAVSVTTAASSTYPSGTGLMPIVAYQRGIDPNWASTMSIGYRITDRLSIGVNAFFNSAAETLLTQGLQASLSF